MRFLRFTNWLTETGPAVRPIAGIWFEEVRRHAGTDAAHVFGGLLATLTTWAELRGIPYSGVPVGTIKKHATGRGNAPKQDIIAAARARGFSPADDKRSRCNRDPELGHRDERGCRVIDLNPEWRSIPGWPEYDVSEDGRVRRAVGGKGARAGRILKQWRNPQNQYLYVQLWRGNRRTGIPVHRLVAMAFLGRPPSERHVVAHDDGTRDVNQPWNLRWATQRENVGDTVRHGTHNRGSRNGQAKDRRSLRARDPEDARHGDSETGSWPWALASPVRPSTTSSTENAGGMLHEIDALASGRLRRLRAGILTR